jgi:predicted nucleic acid-binding Zn ribbon protein
MKICNKCNTENPDDAKFCRKCGKELHNKKNFILILIGIALLVIVIIAIINSNNQIRQIDDEKIYEEVVVDSLVVPIEEISLKVSKSLLNDLFNPHCSLAYKNQ